MISIDRLKLARGRDLTLGVLMERLAAVHGDRRMVSEADGGLTATFSEAAALVDRWAHGIAARSEPGDAVVIATDNGYRQFLLTLAAARAGRLPAPVNDQMAAKEVEHVVADSGASLVVSAADEVDDGGRHGRAVRADPSDVGALFYTSGTTGKPKGAELTHRGLLGGTATGALASPLLGGRELVLGLPVAHIFGFVAVTGAACCGAQVFFFPPVQPGQGARCHRIAPGQRLRRGAGHVPDAAGGRRC